MSALLMTVAIACFVLAGIGLVGSVILFKTLRIWEVFGELSGRSANNAIAKLREQGSFRAHKGRSLQSIIYGTGDGSVDFAAMDGQAAAHAYYASGGVPAPLNQTGGQAAAQTYYASGYPGHSGSPSVPAAQASAGPLRTGSPDLTEAHTVVLDRGSEAATVLLSPNTENATELLSPNTEAATELLAAHNPQNTGEPHKFQIKRR